MSKFFKKPKIIFSVFVLFIIAILFSYLKTEDQIYENNSKTPEIQNISQACFENECFKVEIADTEQKREIGLMNKENLAMSNGMLFIFEKEGIYKFWMKNTLIPLDIVWIDKNNEIIFIKENAEPCKVEQCELFGPNEKAKYVLEINGRLAEEIGLKVGNKVEYK
ncbi:DUF192 domain-containing protein [Candidatus Parcubacteria bacterium]|nr:DUF192 domain-containing protein [Candidatus Parcubacteria bacterium]